MKRFCLLLLFSTLILLSSSRLAFAATYYWVGGSGTWNNSSTINWALTSGGGGGAGIPGVADNVIFDSNSGGGIATVGANITIANLTMSGYTGTINLSSFSLTVSGNLNNEGTITTGTSTGTIIGVAGGSTISLGPTLIHTCQDLQNINNNLSGNYQLTNDIDCSDTKNWNNGSGFIPLGITSPVAGNPNNLFEGTLDGQNHTISGLYINQPSYSADGMFASIDRSGYVFNLNLQSITVNGGVTVGSLSGILLGTINHVRVNNSNTTGTSATGGLVGASSGTIINSAALNVNVHSGGDAGGLVGTNEGNTSNPGSILDSYTTGLVNGSYAGGIVGTNDGATITNSYSFAHVSGPSSAYLGGLVGYNFDYELGTQYSFYNSYAAGKVDSAIYSGGLLAASSDSINDAQTSYWDNQATGQSISAGVPSTFGKTTIQMLQQSTYQSWDFINTWIADGVHYPILIWQEQSQIDQWNTLNALNPSQITTFENSSPPDTINWSTLSNISQLSINWVDVQVMSKPPVWNYQQTVPTAGLLNSINWNYLGELGNSNINWIDVLTFSQTGINWSSINPLIHSGVNWLDWAISTTAGINWIDLAKLSKAGINWNSIGTLPFGSVNWTDLAHITKEGINWQFLSLLSNSNANWNNLSVLNQVPITFSQLQTLKTIAVSNIAQSAPAPTTAQITLNLTGNGSGKFTSTPAGINCTSGSSSGCTSNFTLNQPITLNFTSINNSVVSNWGGCTPTSNTSCTVTPGQNLVINIAINQTYSITSSVAYTSNISGTGGVIISSIGGTITPLGVTNVISGQSQTYQITANPGYAIQEVLLAEDNWGTGSAIPTTTYTYTFNNVTSNHTIQAIFTPEYTLNLQAEGAGSGTLSNTMQPPVTIFNCLSQSSSTKSCTGTYYSGEIVTLTATPNSLSSFKKWSGISGCSTNSTCTFTINGNINATAEFDLLPSTKVLNISTAGSGRGTITSLPAFTNCTANLLNPASNCTGEYKSGTKLTLTETPASGSVFERWVGIPGCSIQSSCSFTIKDNVNAYAIFAQLYTITATAGTGGNISPSGNITAKKGADRIFLILPNRGYEINQVLVDNKNVRLLAGFYIFTDINASHTISVTFKKK